MTSLRLDKEIESRLTNMAKATGRTKTFYIRKLIEEHIDGSGRQIHCRKRLENPAKRLTSKEMRQELSLED